MKELIYFCERLRECKVAVYKHTVIDYAMRLIGTHEAALNFARVHDGEYVLNEDKDLGGFAWDMLKWDNWYYRRFLGDHPELSTGECGIVWVQIFVHANIFSENLSVAFPLPGAGNRKILDAARAK